MAYSVLDFTLMGVSMAKGGIARWRGKTVRNKDEQLSEAKNNGKTTL
jgi:hypothetical protein